MSSRYKWNIDLAKPKSRTPGCNKGKRGFVFLGSETQKMTVFSQQLKQIPYCLTWSLNTFTFNVLV